MLLEQDGQRFRSSLPIELISIKYATDHARGDVLVCGLGLGLMLRSLQNNVLVKSITCVEQDGELIELLSGYFAGVKFIHEETVKYMDHTDARYDFIFLDAGYDSVSAFYEIVAPFRKKSKEILKPCSVISDICCWNEEVMRGQIMDNIHNGIAMKFDISELSDEELATRRTYSMAEMDFFTKFGVVVPDENRHELVAAFVREWELK